MNPIITYRADEYPLKAKMRFHSIDLTEVRELYNEFMNMDIEEFKKSLQDRLFRNKVRHFITHTVWVKCLPVYEMHYLFSDYGALHILIHMEEDYSFIDRYADTVLKQIKEFCYIPEGGTPEWYKNYYNQNVKK